MTNLKIEIAIEGEKQVAAVFADLEKEVSDLRKPLGKIKQHLIKVWQQNFQSEGSKLGKKWKKLSPEYARQKAKKYPGKGILIASGKMVRSFKGDVKRTSLTLYNSTHYFKYHQSKQPRTSNLPRRVMMKINDAGRSKIFEEFTKHINDKIPFNMRKK